MFVKKYYSFFKQAEKTHKHETRHKSLLNVPQTKLTFVQRNVTSRIITIYNNIPNEIKNLEGAAQRRSLKAYLQSNAFYKLNEYLK